MGNWRIRREIWGPFFEWCFGDWQDLDWSGMLMVSFGNI